MGSSLATPGKAVGSQQQADVAPPQQAATPGKSTLVQQDHPTGNEGIDSGGQGSCANGKNAGCFLAPLQRTELNRQSSARLANASKNYGIAVTELKLETTIKRVDELPWYLTLVLGACATALEGLAGMATKALKKPGAAAQAMTALGSEATVTKSSLAEAVNVANNAAKEAANDLKEAGKEAEKEMKSLTEQQVETAIRASIDIGKEKASAGLTAVTSADSSEANEKAQALNYADILNGRADVMFEQLNQDIGRATDAIAMAIWRSLDPSMHSASMYKGKLGASLKRYSESNVSKMGRETGFDEKSGKHAEKEVRIAKLITPGAGIKYVYMDRVFDGWYRDVNLKHPGTAERSPAYDAGENQLSLEQDASWKVEGKEKHGAEKPLAPDRMLNYVEPEFQELAIQKQKHIWLNEPETFQMTYANGHPQVIKVAGS